MHAQATCIWIILCALLYCLDLNLQGVLWTRMAISLQLYLAPETTNTLLQISNGNTTNQTVLSDRKIKKSKVTHYFGLVCACNIYLLSLIK